MRPPAMCGRPETGALIQDTAKDVDAMNVDQELRLTLLEMGISSTDAQAF